MSTRKNKNEKLDLLKHFRKMFMENIDKEKEFKKPEVVFFEPSHTVAVIPKKEWVVNTIRTLFCVEEKRYDESKIQEVADDLFTPEKEVTEVILSGYIVEIIFEIAKHYDAVRFVAKKNKPLYVETSDFVFIAAPRIGAEWDRFV